MQQQYHHNLATEAIRAFFTLQYHWLNNEETYLQKQDSHCGSAATYLIYFTNRQIQNLILNFVSKYSCHSLQYPDLLDLESFGPDYEYLLQMLELEVNQYAKQHFLEPCDSKFESIRSIFNPEHRLFC